MFFDKRLFIINLETFWYAFKLWGMMMAILLYLFYADFSAAPEFIYDQF